MSWRQRHTSSRRRPPATKAAELRSQAAELFAQSDLLTSDPFYLFLGVLDGHTNRFLAPGTLDGPEELDGPQGGLLADAAARDGLGVIDHSVAITLNLAGPLSADAQAAFLRGVVTDSFVEYGNEDAFALAAVSPPTASAPEPGMLILLASSTPLAAGRILRRRSRPMTTRNEGG